MSLDVYFVSFNMNDPEIADNIAFNVGQDGVTAIAIGERIYDSEKDASPLADPRNPVPLRSYLYMDYFWGSDGEVESIHLDRNYEARDLVGNVFGWNTACDYMLFSKEQMELLFNEAKLQQARLTRNVDNKTRDLDLKNIKLTIDTIRRLLTDVKYPEQIYGFLFVQ